MRSGKQLGMDHNNLLINQVNNDEIIEALKGIGDHKSPGVDGYGSKFFKACWHIVKDDGITAIHEFFKHGMILRNFTRTRVNLIPKTNKAKKTRDYKPIVGCSIVNKVIFRILTKRLGIFLPITMLRGYTRKGRPP